MACLKVGDIRRFAIFMNHFDAVVVRVIKDDSKYELVDCNGLKRIVPFGSAVGKCSVSDDVRKKLLKIAQEYIKFDEANLMVLKYENAVKNSAETIRSIRKELHSSFPENLSE